jgi:hypothetical protein
MRSYALATIAGMFVLYLISAVGVAQPGIPFIVGGGHSRAASDNVFGEVGKAPVHFAWLNNSTHLTVPLVPSGAELKEGVLSADNESSYDFEALVPLIGSLESAENANVQVVYNNPSLLAEGVMYREFTIEKLLHECLYDERLDGISINPFIDLISASQSGGLPNSAVLDPFDIVRAIGFLHADHEHSNLLSAATSAYNKGDYFATVYYVGSLFQQKKLTTDEYYEAKRLQLSSYLQLKFPGAVTRTRFELLSIQREHGFSESLQALQQQVYSN